MKVLSVVIPVFNESTNILELYQRLSSSLKKSFSLEIIFVDDGSTDTSREIIKGIHKKDSRVKLIELSRNFGQHIALSAGLDYCHGDFVVLMDADLQDKPEEIIVLYKKLCEGYDVVYGERTKKQFGLLKRLSSYLFVLLLQFLCREPIVISSTIFRIMTRQVVESTRQLKERNRYLIGIIGWVGFRHTSCKVRHGKRYSGNTKYSFSKQLELALDAILSFSSHPLRLVIQAGFLFVAISIVLMIYTIVNKVMFQRPVLGWSSLIFSILLLGGIQIIILGIVGEYVGRIYIESKKRPLYVIKSVTE